MTIELQQAAPLAGARREERRSFVVPLSGTAEAVAAVRVARVLAQATGGTVHLVHVAERAAVPLSELVARLHLQPGELFGSVLDELTGAPAERILALGELLEKPTVVMSAAPPEEGLGPVCGEVLERSRTPVVLVKPERLEAPWSLTHLLLPHDGRSSAAQALGPAVELAERAGAQLTVVLVAGVASSEGLPAFIDQPQHDGPAWTRTFLERLAIGCGTALQASTRLMLLRGEAGPEIVRYAARQEADLVALSWSGESGPGRAPVLREVVHRCSCPVMVLRAAR